MYVTLCAHMPKENPNLSSTLSQQIQSEPLINVPRKLLLQHKSKGKIGSISLERTRERVKSSISAAKSGKKTIA